MIAVFILAQWADAVSALLASLARPAFVEESLLPGIVMAQPGWLLPFKLAGVIFIGSLIFFVDIKRPRLAGGLWVLGIVAGVVGLISNLAVLAA